MLVVIDYDTSMLGVQGIEWLPRSQLNRMGSRCRWPLIDVAQSMYNHPQVLLFNVSVEAQPQLSFQESMFKACFSGCLFRRGLR
jgi:hypothetical protein